MLIFEFIFELRPLIRLPVILQDTIEEFKETLTECVQTILSMHEVINCKEGYNSEKVDAERYHNFGQIELLVEQVNRGRGIFNEYSRTGSGRGVSDNKKRECHLARSLSTSEIHDETHSSCLALVPFTPNDSSDSRKAYSRSSSRKKSTARGTHSSYYDCRSFEDFRPRDRSNQRSKHTAGSIDEHLRRDSKSMTIGGGRRQSLQDGYYDRSTHRGLRRQSFRDGYDRSTHVQDGYDRSTHRGGRRQSLQDGYDRSTHRKQIDGRFARQDSKGEFRRYSSL